ncbi:hypothetical protein CYMTET_28810, partial [Cymbomonas tetramitiformis]
SKENQRLPLIQAEASTTAPSPLFKLNNPMFDPDAQDPGNSSNWGASADSFTDVLAGVDLNLRDVIQHWPARVLYRYNSFAEFLQCPVAEVLELAAQGHSDHVIAQTVLDGKASRGESTELNGLSYWDLYHADGRIKDSAENSPMAMTPRSVGSAAADPDTWLRRSGDQGPLHPSPLTDHSGTPGTQIRSSPATGLDGVGEREKESTIQSLSWVAIALGKWRNGSLRTQFNPHERFKEEVLEPDEVELGAEYDVEAELLVQSGSDFSSIEDDEGTSERRRPSANDPMCAMERLAAAPIVLGKGALEQEMSPCSSTHSPKQPGPSRVSSPLAGSDGKVHGSASSVGSPLRESPLRGSPMLDPSRDCKGHAASLPDVNFAIDSDPPTRLAALMSLADQVASQEVVLETRQPVRSLPTIGLDDDDVAVDSADWQQEMLVETCYEHGKGVVDRARGGPQQEEEQEEQVHAGHSRGGALAGTPPILRQSAALQLAPPTETTPEPLATAFVSHAQLSGAFRTPTPPLPIPPASAPRRDLLPLPAKRSPQLEGSHAQPGSTSPQAVSVSPPALATPSSMQSISSSNTKQKLPGHANNEAAAKMAMVAAEAVQRRGSLRHPRRDSGPRAAAEPRLSLGSTTQTIQEIASWLRTPRLKSHDGGFVKLDADTSAPAAGAPDDGAQRGDREPLEMR